MPTTSKILAKRADGFTERKRQLLTVAMTVFIAAVAIIMVGCQRKPVLSHARYVHLPAAGWQQTLPLTFTPEYDDSTATYDLTLAVRHESSYAYSNLSLVIDVIAADSTINRLPVHFTLADEYGNWSGGGFGTLYQDSCTILQGVSPEDARSVVVWQVMRDCDTLRGIIDVGLFSVVRF